MEQTSKMSIVVNTTRAVTDIDKMSRALTQADAAADNLAKRLSQPVEAKMFSGAALGASNVERELAKLNSGVIYTSRVLRDFTDELKKVKSQLIAMSTQANLSGVEAAAGISKVATQANRLATAMGKLSASGDPSANINKTAVAIKTLAEAADRMGTSSKGAENINKIAKSLEAITKASAKVDSIQKSFGKVEGAVNKGTAEIKKFSDSLVSNGNQLDKWFKKLNDANQKVDSLGGKVTNTANKFKGLDAALDRTAGKLTGVETPAQKAAGAVHAAADANTKLKASLAGLPATIGSVNGVTSAARIAHVNYAAAATAAAAANTNLARSALAANASTATLTGTMNRLRTIMAGSASLLVGVSVLKTADAMQNLDSQVKLVTKSESEFLVIRQKVRAIADKNYNDIEATTNLYQKSARALSNLGKSQADSLLFTDAVSLAMRTGGRSANEQASAVLQLGQAMGAGVLMGDEFRSISENAPILLDLVSKRMGVLPGQLKEMASEGKITAEIMFDAFSENIDLLEEMAAKMPLTMTQGFTVAKNAYKNYVGDMLNSTGGLSSIIADSLKNIGANFSTLASIVGTILLGAMIKFSSAAIAATVATRGLGVAALAATGATTLAAAGSATLTAATVGMYSALVAYLKVSDVWVNVKSRLTILQNRGVSLSWAGVAQAALGATTAVGRFAVAAGATGAAGAAKGLSGALNLVTGSIMRMAGALNAHPIMALAGVLITIVASTRDAEGRMLGLSGALSSLGDAISLVGEMLGDFITFAVQGIGTLVGKAFEFFSSFTEGSKDANGKSTGYFSEFFKTSESGFVGFLQIAARVFDAFGVTIYAAVQTAVNAFKNLVIRAKNDISTFKSWIGFGDGSQQALIENTFGGNMAKRYDATGGGDMSALLNSYIGAKADREAADKALLEAEVDGGPMDAKKAAAAIALKKERAANQALKDAEAADKAARKKASAEKKYVSIDEAALKGKAKVTSPYGGARKHSGVDNRAAIGTQVYAPISGRISVDGGTKHPGGYQLYITADDGSRVGFSHLSKYDVVPGERVEAGQRVAKSGNTGYTGKKNKDGTPTAYVQHLHTTYTNAAGQKVDPTKVKVLKPGYNTAYDSQQDRLEKGQATAAARAEKLRLDGIKKAAEEKQKEIDRQKAFLEQRQALIATYGTQEARLALEHNKRLEAIRVEGLGLSEAEILDYEAKSKAQMDRELEGYKNQLTEKVESLKAHTQTEAEVLKTARDEKLKAAKLDDLLSRPENAAVLEEVLLNIEQEYQFKLERHEALLAKEVKDMYAFNKTEKELYVASWDARMAEAQLATDELRDIRIAALVAEHAKDSELFTLNQDLKLLKLREQFMTQKQYQLELYNLQKSLNEASNDDPETKQLNQDALDKSAKDRAEEVQKRVGGAYSKQSDRLSGRWGVDSTPISDALKADLDLAKEAMEEGLITQEEFHARSAELEEESIRAKRDLTIESYQEKVSMVADSFKAIFGEHSKAYRVMFAVEKGFAIARSVMAIQTAIAQAFALPYPANLGAVATIATATGSIVSNIQSVRQPQISGQAHDGLANVPKEGTYILDAGERVVKPRDNQKLTKFLDTVDEPGKGGKDGGVNLTVNNYSSAEVSTSTNKDGDIELRITNAINKQVPAQLANPSSPIGKSLSNNWQTTPRR